MRRIVPALLLILLLCASASAQSRFLRYHHLRDLRAHAQSTPDMTVAVAEGRVYVVGALVEYAGGNSGTFTAPGSNNRIDLLCIDASGTLSIIQGTAAGSPTAPVATPGKMPICLVYLKSTSTSIQAYDTSTAAHGYILADVRPFIKRDWITSLGTVDIFPSLTATDNIITITNQVALGANDYLDHIHIDGDNLDPSGVEAEIHGLHVNFSGINTSNDPMLTALEINMPRHDDEAVLITNGRILHNLTASSVAATHHTAYSIVLDMSSQSANAITHGIDFSLGLTGSGEITALGIHPGIKPIHQHIGTFQSPGAKYACRQTSGPTFTDDVDNQTIFVANDDAVLIGDTGTFDEIQFVLSSEATKDVKPSFWYWNTSDVWIQFFPIDNTDGFRQDGAVSYDSGDFTNWKSTGDPDAGGAVCDAGYWIKIQRERVSSPGTVTVTTMKFLDPTQYEWDAAGLIHVSEVQVGLDDAGAGDIHAYGAATGSADGGCLKLYMAADHDTTYNNWALNVDEDDLNIKRATTTILTFTGADGHVRIANTYDFLPATTGGSDLGADGKEFGNLWANSLYLDADVDLHDGGAGILELGTDGGGIRQLNIYSQTAGDYMRFRSETDIAYLNTYGQAFRWVTGRYFQLITAANQKADFFCGGLFSFGDVDDSDAVRLTIDSATGDIIAADDSTSSGGDSTHWFLNWYTDQLYTVAIGPGDDANLIELAADALTVNGSLDVGSQLTATYGGGSTLELDRTSAETNTMRLALELSHITTGDMADNFGPGLQFNIQDDSSALEDIARIQAQRDGADDSGRLEFRVTTTGTYSTPLILDGSGATVAGILTVPNEGLHVFDTGGDHDLIIKPGTDLGADRILTITTGDAARTITLSGNPTLADWFDQGLKVANSPEFGGVTLTDGGNLVFDTTAGTQIGTAANQKIGFFGVTPVVQQSHIADATGPLGDLVIKFNTLLSQLEAVGVNADS